MKGGDLPMDMLYSLPIPIQALLASLMTYTLTGLGAALVFLVRRPSKLLMDLMMALGSGFMLASSFWSLLDPGIALANTLHQPVWLIMPFGLLAGAAFLLLGGVFDRHTRIFAPNSHATTRSRMLFTSITLHNIPEGLAVGVAFGALTFGNAPALCRAAWLLALGIAIQNLPEGAAISFPLLREGSSPRLAFRWGHLSGLVEPITALVGVFISAAAQGTLPFLLAFAGGAMIFVILSELIPENQTSSDPRLMNATTIVGFAIMMVLDVSFA